jgi:hypothetical protein
LSLISGGWTVNAGNNILLQEVRNPNGIFNNLGFGSASLRHYFDYAPDDYTILNAGNGVELLGTALPRYSDSFDAGIPCIYPPILEITAGAGGVTMGNDVILYPSAQGWLGITTSAGGALASSETGADQAQLIVSDSGKDQYLAAGDFGLGDHAAVPVHLNDEQTIELNIAGDMEDVYLGVPERAVVKVGGDMINCRFDGQNLQAGDVTTINVTGAVENRSEFTSLSVSAAPDYGVLDEAYPPLTGSLAAPGSLASLASLFYYDPATQTLTFQGRMTTDELQALLNLTVPVYGANGQPVLDANRNPVTEPAQFVSAATLESLYAASQNVPSAPDTGYRLGGGGTFNITAASLDLGATAGIVSEGPAENPALANDFTRGADINVQVTGDLNMFSTTISCLDGGNINVQAGGAIDLGSTYFTGNDAFPRGIFSTDDSDVTVIAGGDLTLNGSRIAAYDGGNVTVESVYGNVVVGAGGQGSATVDEYYVNPVTRAVSAYTTTIPGSGILATTFPVSLNPAFPTSQTTVGDILVATPQGDITATAAGIVQVPLNGGDAKAGTVTLTAGTENADGTTAYLGNIDVSGSGVIGANVQLKATGSIKGAIVARDNLNVTALQDVAVAAFAVGEVNVKAGENISGTIIGLGDLNVSAGNIEASLLSENVSASGTVTSTKIGFAPGTSARSASQGETLDTPAKAAAMGGESSGDEDAPHSDGAEPPRLKRLIKRVTILLR